MYKNIELPFAASFGLIFGIITYIILKAIDPEYALMFALFAFAFCFIVMYLYLLIHNKRMEKRYAEIEKLILSPVFYKTNGNFNLGKKTVNGNIYFCETGILFASFDEKPYRLHELPLLNILKYEIDRVHLNIYTKDNQVFVITTPDAPKVREVLKERGWIE